MSHEPKLFTYASQEHENWVRKIVREELAPSRLYLSWPRYCDRLPTPDSSRHADQEDQHPPKTDLERAADACEEYAKIQYGQLSNKPKGWVCSTCRTNHDNYAAFALQRAATYIRSLAPTKPSPDWRAIAERLRVAIYNQPGYLEFTEPFVAACEAYDRAVKEAQQ